MKFNVKYKEVDLSIEYSLEEAKETFEVIKYFIDKDLHVASALEMYARTFARCEDIARKRNVNYYKGGNDNENI